LWYSVYHYVKITEKLGNYVVYISCGYIFIPYSATLFSTYFFPTQLLYFLHIYSLLSYSIFYIFIPYSATLFSTYLFPTQLLFFLHIYSLLSYSIITDNFSLMLNVNTCTKNYGARRIDNWKENVFKWYIYIYIFFC
jgi:hypothetical protein